MKHFRINFPKTLLFTFLVIFISSCNNNDDDDILIGKWNPMKWKYENVDDGIKIVEPSGKDKDNVRHTTEIVVSKAGSVDIVCKNYNSFWFAEYPDMTNEGDYWLQFNSEFCKMEIEDNTLHCDFFNIEQQNQEEFHIVVTAGDIFYYFQIKIK